MIFKSHEIKKIDLAKNKILLFYGKNEGLKNETANFLVEGRGDIINYYQNDILDNKNHFIDNILTGSLFENQKTIIIKRVTDKLFPIIEELSLEKIGDTVLILNAENLEKRSKLRSYFEKKNLYCCIAFYTDTNQTLMRLANNFIREKNISLSSENLNLIISKNNGDRENLYNDLKKVESFWGNSNSNKLTPENIKKLINLSEDHSVSEIIDNCLAKNKKKIVSMLSENNFSNDDCILITRTFLNKSKRILNLVEEFKKNKSIDLTISSAKPPIFWKDKEIYRKQISKWSPNKIRALIYELNEIELLVKKNSSNSINLISDFILEQST